MEGNMTNFNSENELEKWIKSQKEQFREISELQDCKKITKATVLETDSVLQFKNFLLKPW